MVRSINHENELIKCLSPQETAVVVGTYYPNWQPGELSDITDTQKVRGDLGLQFITRASQIGFRVVVSESGSSNPFLEALPKENVTVIPLEKPSMAPGKKLGIKIASKLPGVKYIFRSEGEKVDVVPYIQAICLPLVTGEAQIVVGNRRDQEFKASYPDYGYESEVKVNNCYDRILRSAKLIAGEARLDLFSGFVGLVNDPEVVALFMERYEYTGSRETRTRSSINIDGWSNCQIFPMIKALRNGVDILGVEIPFQYAPTQRANEMAEANKMSFIEKRRRQRLGCVTEGVLFARYLLGQEARSNLRLIES